MVLIRDAADVAAVASLRRHADIESAAVALGPDAHAVALRELGDALLVMPGLDPLIHFPRSGGAGGAPLAIIDVPDDTDLSVFGADVGTALSTLSATAGRWFHANALLVCGRRARLAPRGTRAVMGFESDVELATLMRQASALVVLDGAHVSPLVTSAMLVGTDVHVIAGMAGDLRIAELSWANEALWRGALRAACSALGSRPLYGAALSCRS